MTQTWRRWRIHHRPASVTMDESFWQAAFASDDRQHVNQHFGMATGFCIYQISPQAVRLREVLQAPTHGGHGNRVGERVAMLTGCRLLFCAAVGEAAKEQLAAAGITAMIVPPGSEIAPLLKRLQEQPALARPALFKPPLPPAEAEERFMAMLANGWDE